MKRPSQKKVDSPSRKTAIRSSISRRTIRVLVAFIFGVVFGLFCSVFDIISGPRKADLPVALGFGLVCGLIFAVYEVFQKNE
jgi:drug/metabolite transporter (DMT)-like permease